MHTLGLGGDVSVDAGLLRMVPQSGAFTKTLICREMRQYFDLGFVTRCFEGGFRASVECTSGCTMSEMHSDVRKSCNACAWVVDGTFYEDGAVLGVVRPTHSRS